MYVSSMALVEVPRRVCKANADMALLKSGAKPVELDLKNLIVENNHSWPRPFLQLNSR